jgi:hypothetical protein
MAFGRYSKLDTIGGKQPDVWVLPRAGGRCAGIGGLHGHSSDRAADDEDCVGAPRSLRMHVLRGPASVLAAVSPTGAKTDTDSTGAPPFLRVHFILCVCDGWGDYGPGTSYLSYTRPRRLSHGQHPIIPLRPSCYTLTISVEFK